MKQEKLNRLAILISIVYRRARNIDISKYIYDSAKIHSRENLDITLGFLILWKINKPNIYIHTTKWALKRFSPNAFDTLAAALLSVPLW